MKKATLKDIAEAVGVSKATVSMVLNNKEINVSESTREKIFNSAKELNYIPNSVARSLSTKKTETIGIILPDIENPFFSEIARAIEDVANKFNYNVILCNTDNKNDKEEQYIKLLISKLVDGIIFLTGVGKDESIDILKNNNIPFVLVDRYMENVEEFNGVYCLNEEGVEQGVDYLLQNGKKHIAFVTGPMELSVSKKRLDGYKKSMNNRNIYKDELIFEGDFTTEGGIKVTQNILKSKISVDAIFYGNDAMALGGMKVLLRAGYRIPEDISIIGFDNIRISSFVQPELTTIGQPIYHMGKEACKLLINTIEHKDEKKQIYFKPELIIRDTV
ncbi:LacI family DNA-binding transcriptional regulator [Clostridium sp. KNHs214]|uniref:LacI family DNA-binding transcriptional regulator n=1 Tax=Clostridium sp. KNHs214 TaxID=1540257 RepID=UPI00054D9241|nr:LacI family DNA-binding transcriptional regulator [Clostridium sp. KNHs214]